MDLTRLCLRIGAEHVAIIWREGLHYRQAMIMAALSVSKMQKKVAHTHDHRDGSETCALWQLGTSAPRSNSRHFQGPTPDIRFGHSGSLARVDAADRCPLRNTALISHTENGALA